MSSHLVKPKNTFLLIGFGAGALLFLLLRFQLEWQWYWGWWTALSVVTTAAYGFDKLQSRRENAQRVPEMVLHLLALGGGVAGGWVGRGVFRHKTRHAIFTVVLIAATLLHIGLLWVITKGGVVFVDDAEVQSTDSGLNL